MSVKPERFRPSIWAFLVFMHLNEQKGKIYLHIGEVYIVVLQEANELLKILFGWEVMTTIWPYSL